MNLPPYDTRGGVRTPRRVEEETRDMLQDTYPYYLANEAKQPNTDLAVTDKYTGEVAFRPL